MNGTVIILAIGDSTWGQMALNLALSIKANEPFRKILLIHDGKSITEIESVIDRYFDYTYLLLSGIINLEKTQWIFLVSLLLQQ